MFSKRALIASLTTLVVIGWVVSVLLSLRQVGGLFPDFSIEHADAPSDELQNFQAIVESAVPDLPAELHRRQEVSDETPGTLITPQEPVESPDDRGVEVSVLDPPLSSEERCVLMGDVDSALVYGRNLPGRRAVDFYWRQSEVELKAIADLHADEFAQYFYAERLILEVGAGIGNGTLNPKEIPVETMETIRQYFSAAIRKHVKGRGPYHLAWLEMHLGDKAASAAWLSIDQRMGGNAFEQFEQNALRTGDGFFILDSYDKSQGEVRAEELIRQYELSEGLVLAEDCL